MFGVMFFENKEEAFGLYTTMKSLGFVISLGMGSHVCIKGKLILMIVCLLLGSVQYIFAILKTNKNKKEQKEEGETVTMFEMQDS